MTGLERARDVLGELQVARQEAPSEVRLQPDGRREVISWQGTPVTEEWLTNYVNALIGARLVEQWKLGLEGDKAATERARAANRERLAAWHRPLLGLPREGLEAAREHFESHGVPDGRWYLRPGDVSRWVRARSVRRIPEGQECEAHPGQWADTCGACASDRRRSMTPEAIRRIREQIEEEDA